MVFEISQNIACKAFEKAITDIDDTLRKKRERGVLENTGKRGKYFLTRFGDICYTRTRYKDKKTGKSCYLLDEALSIVKNQRISLSRARIECFLSAFSSYREVVKGISLLIGGPRCHEAIRQSVIKEGKLILGNQKKKLKQIENLDYPDKEASDTAYMEADATYILCLYHLYKRFKESLARRKPEQKVIKELLLSNQINKGLSVIDQLIRSPYDLKEKNNLKKLYTYISRNRQGITNQFILKNKGIERAGAIESNINKAIASRFKKKGMSWSKTGALAILKIKETVINGK